MLKLLAMGLYVYIYIYIYTYIYIYIYNLPPLQNKAPLIKKTNLWGE